MKPDAIATMRRLIALMVRLDQRDEAAALRLMLVHLGGGRGGRGDEAKGEGTLPVPAKKVLSIEDDRSELRGPTALSQRVGAEGSSLHQAQALPRGGS